MRERIAGFLLMMIFIVPLAVLGYLLIVYTGFFGKTARALDHFVNATLFNGYAWESVSAHAWHEQHRW